MKSFTSARLQPIDLAELNFAAKIDYVTLARPSALLTPADLKRLSLNGRVSWARSANYRFFSIHDPTPNDLSKVEAAYGSVEVVELEIAVDLRPISRVPQERGYQILCDVLIELFAKQLDPRGGLGMEAASRAFYRQLDSGYTILPFNKRLPRATDQQLHGWRHDGVQVKCYFKRRDRGAPLAPSQYVARVEVRLAASGLNAQGIATLSDLRDFSFRRRLMPYFRHVDATVRLHKRSRRRSPLRSVLAAKQSEFDEAHFRKVGVGAFLRGGNREDAHVRLVRNVAVNNRIGQALTRLEQRFCAKKPCKASPGGCEKVVIDQALASLQHSHL
ncbi:hypothetical protein LJR084_002454 [Variovorax sp. LjRoot84]|uniref:hypothetical protein n=1 Tax=Variovorax sp. LjRoot84 TaxID=3342340 RepID=UPI003ED0B1A3